MSMRKTLLSTVFMASMLVLTMAVQAPAETLRPKVDNFILFFDYSGSMAQESEVYKGKKIELAKSLATRMNVEIPNLNYQSGVNTFAPFETFQTPARYNKADIAASVGRIDTKFDIYGRNTPMGFGLDAIDPVLAKLNGSTALIIFTDGDSNYGNNPVTEARALYAKYPNLCIHIVSYGDTTHGKEVIAQIRGLKGCSVVGDPLALADAGNLKQFVRDVFYDVVPDAVMAPVSAPTRAAPVAAGACETITLGNLNFAFDKYMIVPEMVPALDQALSVIKNSSCSQFVVEGHTDSVGSVPYNQGLSERRANSVAKWLMEKGYQGKLVVEGKGKLSPKFDNGTPDGRHLNRRVEIRSN